ncbi:MAG: Helicase associated domain protein, partial [Oscillospiraceae bacterium]|nr:Helicase associated domain protein [Oscillospiraceae bacterium]
IIIDEFHRCGAEQWGQGVQNLIAAHPKAKLLGLSATNIRYLDNQRDMADELFEGKVASEMTLGEAIARGILNAPTYVLSVFAYQKDYERLKGRVRRAKNKAVRDEAGRYLEALRRTLEQADGLDAIFDKHMTDRHGKYLVFCANAEHMREMMSHVPEWFGKIDAAPNIYSALSEDPTAAEAFAAFKADDSAHLKLLFCVDMLNEGVHVEDVSGVILFRPTVSPIIYKQQIGRALSASKLKEPIIFDIVNNVENLYSIGALQQEMQAAVNYYRFLGEGGMVVNERFKLIDELRDARALFEQLNDTLVASWDLMYEYAKQYYDAHGDLNVPRRYKTADGYALGSWLQTQRKVYAGEQYGNLSEERIAKLNAIGMRWGSYLDDAWTRYYQAAKAYYEAHGDLRVNVNETTEDGLALGSWLARLRTYKKSGIRSTYLTPERIAALEQLGMVWAVPDYLWEENFAAAMQYYREHGNLEMPNNHVTAEGLRLGAWVSKQRAIRNGTSTNGAALSQEQINSLDSIGMVWASRHERAWAQGYEEAKRYHAAHGDLDVPKTYAAPSGYALGNWLARRRDKGRYGHTPEQRAQLDALGFVWDKPDPWETRYALAKAYYEAHGNLNCPAQYQAGGVWLYKWLNEQRQIYLGKRRGKALTEEQIRRLDALGMVWDNRNHRKWSAAWEASYQDARAYYAAHGDLKVPDGYKGTSGKLLPRWLLRQRELRRDGKLTDAQIRRLDALQIDWGIAPSTMRRGRRKPEKQ